MGSTYMTAQQEKARKGANLSGNSERRANETKPFATISIADEAEKVNSICEILKEFANACRYALREGDRYAALPMRAEDADVFETVAALLEWQLWRETNGQAGAFRELVDSLPLTEPVRHALRGALVGLECARAQAGLPLTDEDREICASYLRSQSSDPEIWIKIIQSWVMK